MDTWKVLRVGLHAGDKLQFGEEIHMYVRKFIHLGRQNYMYLWARKFIHVGT